MSRILFCNITKRCNVDCPRCYILPEHRARRDTFDLELLERALKSDFFSRTEDRPLLVFQGGEPTLLGERRFREICERVRATHPTIRMTCVTNLLAAPLWLVALAHDFFEGRIETTWAAGRKSTLAGSENDFQACFRRSLRTVFDSGLSCTVNVELNRETSLAGPDAIIDLYKETGATNFEFDVSVDFDKFQRHPTFRRGGYPILPLNLGYAGTAQFLANLQDALSRTGLEGRINCQLLKPPAARGRDSSFNSERGGDFITMNPDGTVTTNPLYSDIPQTYLGNLKERSLNEILTHPNRMRRIVQEIRRREGCAGCDFREICTGGSSHLPLLDGSGECAGFKAFTRSLVTPSKETQKAI